MQAKNRDQYVTAWTRHMNELAAVFLDSCGPDDFGDAADDYARVAQRIEARIELAADRLFPAA